MTQRKCPFAAPLTKGRAACRNAQEVVRRGGSEYDCRSAAHHPLCSRVFDGLKVQALPAFGVEDDPAAMPHSVLVKIQSGGLLGLQRLLEGNARSERIEDAAGLIDRAIGQYGSPQAIPYEETEPDMLNFKLERRARRG